MIENKPVKLKQSKKSKIRKGRKSPTLIGNEQTKAKRFKSNASKFGFIQPRDSKGRFVSTLPPLDTTNLKQPWIKEKTNSYDFIVNGQKYNVSKKEKGKLAIINKLIDSKGRIDDINMLADLFSTKGMNQLLKYRANLTKESGGILQKLYEGGWQQAKQLQKFIGSMSTYEFYLFYLNNKALFNHMFSDFYKKLQMDPISFRYNMEYGTSFAEDELGLDFHEIDNIKFISPMQKKNFIKFS